MFIDEPSMDADLSVSVTCEKTVELLNIAPFLTILCSATFPSPDKLPTLIDLYSRSLQGFFNQY